MNQKKAGVLLSYGQTALSTLISLTYTPVMLRLLGQSEYGLYTLVSGFVSNLSLLSFGMGSAYMRYYSRAEVQDGEEGVARINGMFMTIFFVISLLCLLTGGVLVANVKNIFAANLTAQELDTAKILMALLVVNIAVSFPASVFFSYITAKERFLFQRLVSMLRTVLNPIVMLPLLLMGFGSVALVMVTLILTAVSDAVSIWYCIKKLHMRITFGKFDFGLLRDMAGFSFFIFLNEIINQINWTVDTTLLGIISGTAATAIYGVGSQINQYYMALSTSISGVFTPQINRIVARGEGDEQLTKAVHTGWTHSVHAADARADGLRLCGRAVHLRVGRRGIRHGLLDCAAAHCAGDRAADSKHRHRDSARKEHAPVPLEGLFLHGHRQRTCEHSAGHEVRRHRLRAGHGDLDGRRQRVHHELVLSDAHRAGHALFLEAYFEHRSGDASGCCAGYYRGAAHTVHGLCGRCDVRRTVTRGIRRRAVSVCNG